MGDRIEFQALLQTITNNVYYQSPGNTSMNYPCILYSRKSIRNTNASNSVYKQDRSYTVTVIDRNPDSVIVDKIALLPNCAYDRNYVSNGLYHDVFTIYY